ncbi:MAG: hypothetical protein ABI947_15560 [Chloroflexota bacterium]
MKNVKRFLFLLALLVVFAMPIQAHASLLCRADPIVVLSNGLIMDVGANIAALPSQVTEVHYDLHVPTGVTVLFSLHLPVSQTSQETLAVHADQLAGDYQVNTTVHTNLGNVDMEADTTLYSLMGKQLSYNSIAGREGTPLAVFLHYANTLQASIARS